MTLDEHTPCLACPIRIRYLHDATTVLAKLLEGVELPADVGAVIAEPLAAVLVALQTVRPFVEAHLANQVHAFSDELVDARDPTLPEAA